jgi:hypothetical protein
MKFSYLEDICMFVAFCLLFAEASPACSQVSQDCSLDSHYRASWLNSRVKIEHRKNEMMMMLLLHEMNQENRSERLNRDVDL